MVLITILQLNSCSPSTPEDYKQEAQASTKKLLKTLKKISTKEEIFQHKESIKKEINSLVDLMIEAREAQRFSTFEVSSSSNTTSSLLRSELIRLYQIEGAQEVIEKIQSESLRRLDAYEKERVSNLK
jgi:hypothetical protein